METQQQFLTARQVAKFFGISEGSVWGYKRRGLLPYVRIGHSIRFAIADLQALAERNRTPAKES